MAEFKVNWKIIKELINSGMKAVEIERKYNGAVTAQQIYKKKAQWAKQDYYNNSSRYAKYRTPEYIAWRKAVLKREGERCVVCGRGRPARLQVDHVYQQSRYPELKFSVDNGRTLCIPCHKRTPNYGYKAASYIPSFEKYEEWIKSEKERIRLAKLKKKLKRLK